MIPGEGQRVGIDGKWHDLLPLDALEGFAFRNNLAIAYPEREGWATTRLGSHRWAAWYPGRSERMPEALS